MSKSNMSEYGMVADDVDQAAPDAPQRPAPAGLPTAVVSTNYPLNAIEQATIKESRLLDANATLFHNKTKLAQFAELIIAYKLGKPLKLGADDDQRSAKVDQTVVQGLKAIAKMFRLNENQRYAHYAGLFDIQGWRSTTWEELGRIGCGRARRSPFSRAQVRSILNVLAKTGFIDRKNVFNAGTNQRRLFIRFRADRILQAIDEVIELRKAGVDPAKDVVSDHTLGGGSVEVEPGDGDEKEGLESVPGKAVTSAMHDPIFIINREVADQPSAISDATASLPATVVTTDSPGTQKIKSAGRQPANDIFCFPKHFGNDELIQMIKLIMNQYDMGEITFGQARQIKIWYNSPSASSHMDLKILEDMFAAANGTWSDVQLYRCRPDFFISAWPHILREHRKNILGVDGFGMAEADLAALPAAAVDADIRKQLAWHAERIQEIETGSGKLMNIAQMLTYGNDKAIAFAILVHLQRQELLQEILNFSRDKIWEELTRAPYWLLGLKRVLPEALQYFDTDEAFWDRMQLAARKHYQEAVGRVHVASRWGVEQFNVPS
jgi:hypothetical protein